MFEKNKQNRGRGRPILKKKASLKYTIWFDLSKSSFQLLLGFNKTFLDNGPARFVVVDLAKCTTMARPPISKFEKYIFKCAK